MCKRSVLAGERCFYTCQSRQKCYLFLNARLPFDQPFNPYIFPFHYSYDINTWLLAFQTNCVQSLCRQFFPE